jgi:hypothetical protein
VFVLIRYIPLLVHSLHERLANYLNVPAIWTVVISVLLVPLFIGLGPGFVILIGIGFVWLYMTWNERIVTFLFILALGLSGVWLPAALSWYAADQSEELMLLSRVVRGDAATSEVSRRILDRGGYKDNWPVLFSLALQARRDENYAEALDRYQAVRKLEPDRSSILNNIGNIYFLSKDYNNAVAFYKQALLKDPWDAVGHYNLSLVYRELLLFEDAEKEYNAAQQISLPLIQSFQGMGSVDELFPTWKISIENFFRRSRSAPPWPRWCCREAWPCRFAWRYRASSWRPPVRCADAPSAFTASAGSWMSKHATVVGRNQRM